MLRRLRRSAWLAAATDRLGEISRHSTVRFALASAAGYAVDVLLLVGLARWGGLPRPVNVTVAFWLTYALNFVLNRRFTFRAGHDGDLRGQLLRYLPQVTADYLLTLGGVELFTGALSLPLLTGRLLAGATNAVFNYTVYRWWTFRTAPTGSTENPSTR